MIILTKDNGRITVEDKVVQKSILMLAERSNVGVEKYGTTLEDNDDDDFLQHLAEELGDGINYIMKIKRQEENLINPEDFLEESSFEKFIKEKEWPDNKETDFSIENVRLSVDVLIGKHK